MVAPLTNAARAFGASEQTERRHEALGWIMSHIWQTRVQSFGTQPPQKLL
jgi:hypothetical protein